MVYKKLFLKSLAFLPVFGSIALINYYVDPASLFKSNQYVEEMANRVVHGENLLHVRNYPESLFQEFCIQRMPSPKDVVVLGSSRVRIISSNTVGSKSFFNSNVSSATLEDIIAMYGIYKSRGGGFIPKTIIIGIDPDLFNHEDVSKWQGTMDPYYNDIASQILSVKNITDIRPAAFLPVKIKELFSISYFKESIKNLINSNKDDKKSTYQQNQQDTEDGISSDGSVILAKKYFLLDRNSIRAGIYTNYIIIRENYRVLDEYKKKMFKGFIEMLGKKGVKVVLFMTPEHPLKYKLNNNDPFRARMLNSIEQYVLSFEKKYPFVKVIGSFNPDAGHFQENDFFDDHHLRNDRVLKELFSKVSF